MLHWREKLIIIEYIFSLTMSVGWSLSCGELAILLPLGHNRGENIAGVLKPSAIIAWLPLANPMSNCKQQEEISPDTHAATF